MSQRKSRREDEGQICVNRKRLDCICYHGALPIVRGDPFTVLLLYVGEWLEVFSSRARSAYAEGVRFFAPDVSASNLE